MDCPRIVIAGTQSGVGKTSLTLAFVTALRKRGLNVQTFKVGPDFLDPTYLTVASGRPCYNLDGWMAGSDYVSRLFARVSQGADISVIEGVMGLFDGADPACSQGSTAEIARWLDAPIILVAEVYGMARSLAAIVKGYSVFEKDLNMAGVIANRCGSERHASMLAISLASEALPPLVGGIPQGALPSLPSRHLGLVTANPGNLSLSILDELAAAFERHASVDDIIGIARNAPPLELAAASDVADSNRTGFCPAVGGIEGTGYPGNHSKGISIGVARDAAFHFYYQDLFDELEMRGCTLHYFSPLADSVLPVNLDALYIGGGYPEEHAEMLSTNRKMLSAIRTFASSGRPVYGECGGLMYLCQTLEEEKNGVAHPMVGLIPASTRMLDRLKSLGYVEVTLNANSLWGAEGAVLRGHEFHYSELTSNPAEDPAWKTIYSMKRRRTDDAAREGFQRGRVLASYVHLHLASRPEALKYFIDHCGAQR